MRGKTALPDGWAWDTNGGGTAGTYTKEGLTLWCDGTAWHIRRENGEDYAKTFASLVSAGRFAERKIANKTSEAQIRAVMKYKAANMKRYEINLNTKTDADIIAWLEGRNVAGTIKELIRKEMKNR